MGKILFWLQFFVAWLATGANWQQCWHPALYAALLLHLCWQQIVHKFSVWHLVTLCLRFSAYDHPLFVCCVFFLCQFSQVLSLLMLANQFLCSNSSLDLENVKHIVYCAERDEHPTVSDTATGCEIVMDFCETHSVHLLLVIINGQEIQQVENYEHWV